MKKIKKIPFNFWTCVCLVVALLFLGLGGESLYQCRKFTLPPQESFPIKLANDAIFVDSIHNVSPERFAEILDDQLRNRPVITIISRDGNKCAVVKQQGVDSTGNLYRTTKTFPHPSSKFARWTKYKIKIDSLQTLLIYTPISRRTSTMRANYICCLGIGILLIVIPIIGTLIKRRKEQKPEVKTVV